MLQVHMIRSAPLSALITRGEAAEMRMGERKIFFPQTSRVQRINQRCCNLQLAETDNLTRLIKYRTEKLAY